MKSLKATDMPFTQMNTKDKAIKNKPMIRTLSTTLACLVASSAFALDDRMDDPKPQPEPQEPGHVDKKLPDLMPLGLKLVHDPEVDDWDPVMFEYAHSFRRFMGTMVVANFGNADSIHLDGKLIDSTQCHVGIKVLASTDPVRYPVGHTEYVGGGFIIELKPLDIAEVEVYAIFPKTVTAVEFFAIVDRRADHPKGLDSKGTWEDDFGLDYIGDIDESNEANNVLECNVVHFAEELQQPVELPVQKSPLTVRKK